MKDTNKDGKIAYVTKYNTNTVRMKLSPLHNPPTPPLSSSRFVREISSHRPLAVGIFTRAGERLFVCTGISEYAIVDEKKYVWRPLGKTIRATVHECVCATAHHEYLPTEACAALRVLWTDDGGRG